MIIAVTHQDGEVFQHFGHSEEIKFYRTENGKIAESMVVSTNGQGHGALAYLLAQYNTDILICGGIGGGAQMALAQMGIELFAGVSGNCDAVVQALLDGNLVQNTNVTCNCHHEHGEDHDCGHHDHECGHDHHESHEDGGCCGHCHS